MRYLKQSTSVDVGVGPFLDETDGKTAETALTITQPDVRLKKNGGAWAQKAAAQTLSHEEAGWYEVTLDTTDTDTIGILLVAIHESGALPVWMEFHVLAANVYDSLFGAATDKLEVDVQEINSGTAAADNLKTAADAYSATRGLAGTALPAAAADAAGGLPTTTKITDARLAALDDLINGGRLDLLIDAIKAQTDLLPSDPADASVVAGLIATAQADLTTLVGRLTALRAAALDEVTSARMGALTDWINGGRLDLLLDAVKAVTDALPNAGALTSLAQDATVAKASALSTAQTSIDDLPTNAELATALAAADDAVLAAIAALNNLSQANVRTALGMASANLDTQLGDLPTNAELATALGTADDAVLAAIAALNNLSAAQVNAEVVDVLRTDTGTEVSAVPAAAAAIAAQIQFLFQALRNKVTVSATAKTISNDAGTTVGTKTLSDDGTTYQEGEMA